MAENPIPEKSRVSRIHIGRVFNLGNYENMRYEISVEIGSGDDPANVLRNVERILNDLRAKSGVDEWHLNRARKALEEADEKPGTVTYTKDELDGFRKLIARHEEAGKRREAARAALSTLEYTSEFRDAKDDWDDEY